jgi:hypothetical protein
MVVYVYVLADIEEEKHESMATTSCSLYRAAG